MFMTAQRHDDGTRSAFLDARRAPPPHWHCTCRLPSETVGAGATRLADLAFIERRLARTAALKALHGALEAREASRQCRAPRRAGRASQRPLAVSLAPRRRGYRGARR